MNTESLRDLLVTLGKHGDINTQMYIVVLQSCPTMEEKYKGQEKGHVRGNKSQRRRSYGLIIKDIRPIIEFVKLFSSYIISQDGMYTYH